MDLPVIRAPMGFSLQHARPYRFCFVALEQLVAPPECANYDDMLSDAGWANFRCYQRARGSGPPPAAQGCTDPRPLLPVDFPLLPNVDLGPHDELVCAEGQWWPADSFFSKVTNCRGFPQPDGEPCPPENTWPVVAVWHWGAGPTADVGPPSGTPAPDGPPPAPFGPPPPPAPEPGPQPSKGGSVVMPAILIGGALALTAVAVRSRSHVDTSAAAKSLDHQARKRIFQRSSRLLKGGA